MIAFIHGGLENVKPLYEHMENEFVLYNLSHVYSSSKSHLDHDILQVNSIITLFKPPAWVNDLKEFCENDPSFDTFVSYYLLDDPIPKVLLSCMMINLYDNKDVYVLSEGDDPFYNAFIKSMIKHIENRYGIHCWIINDESDIATANHETTSDKTLKQIVSDVEHAGPEFAYVAMIYKGSLKHMPSGIA